MKFVTFSSEPFQTSQLGLLEGNDLLALPAGHQYDHPATLLEAMQKDTLQETASLLKKHGVKIDQANIRFLPPIPRPPKIFCVGLNYVDHSKESNMDQPTYPTIFARYHTSLTGHKSPIIRPHSSIQLDYEGELVAFIGKGGRHISLADALDHVAGYSVGNEACIRDYQFKAPQWTIGKNFDQTGSIGPAFVTADELPRGGVGLDIQTRLNGVVVQHANTKDMVFDLATVIQVLSEAITLECGDMIIAGTPSGVGMARKPQLWMKPGDTVEVEIEGVGLLSNNIAQES
ncbi:MAG: hypothetical protein JWR68_2784 [Polaromonas sp.]|nr:hypothetical protein [Polaromonas sp.]